MLDFTDHLPILITRFQAMPDAPHFTAVIRIAFGMGRNDHVDQGPLGRKFI